MLRSILYSWTVLTALFVAGVSPAVADGQPRWSQAIRGFVESDSRRPDQRGGTLFVGSSSIRKWDLQEWFPDRPALNRGFGGSTIQDATKHFDILVAKHLPALVVLYAGGNDIARGGTAPEVLRDFILFSMRLREAAPRSRLLYISIKPSQARWHLAGEMQQANALIACHCKKRSRLTFVDVWTPMLNANGETRAELYAPDRLHLSDAGYRLWSNQLAPHFSKAPCDHSTKSHATESRSVIGLHEMGLSSKHFRRRQPGIQFDCSGLAGTTLTRSGTEI